MDSPPLLSFFILVAVQAIDIGLLNFMAKRASDSAQLDASNRTAALAHKYQQIEAMARLVEQEGCFRQTLIGYFAGSEKGFSSKLFYVAARVGFC